MFTIRPTAATSTSAALPIIKLLIDGGAQRSELYVWGFLCAYMTNDYDLAETYLAKAKETGAMDAVTLAASRSDRDDPQAGLNKNLEQLVQFLRWKVSTRIASCGRRSRKSERQRPRPTTCRA